MTTEKQFITTANITKRNTIKLPYELANNPGVANSTIRVNEDIVTITLPPADGLPGEIWQYIHQKQSWIVVTFAK